MAGCTIFSTDGSRKNGKSACAKVIFTENEELPLPTEEKQLNDYTPVLEAELHEITMVLLLIKTHQLPDSVIFTDSQSSLSSLLMSSNGRVNHIMSIVQDQLLQLIADGHGVQLSWVPAHREVLGSELADQPLKERWNIQTLI